MSDFSPLPESISYKQLNSLLEVAQKQPISTKKEMPLLIEEQEAFQKLLTKWSSLSQKLLIELNNKHEYIIAGRDPKSVMALGALGAHLNMAIQAQEASELN